ncbi:hypothetical protein JCM21142_31025 [Saccharicrinis fermentans DSM 9555 = JCM 21142]|uniref:Uncharacterized protein n=1 Tax=Saccharicrinis fermentans DSM 9555 = JCM 21142 TaxID=869213 RepID=W7YD46_9BACT|nr:hypothetical protein JCM21142_31025 [Saccharicrinis fermentans DSM 9555 = JCM 21142]
MYLAWCEWIAKQERQKSIFLNEVMNLHSSLIITFEKACVDYSRYEAFLRNIYAM